MQFEIRKTPKAKPMTQFGGVTQGVCYEVTNRYITRNGKPYIYRMGEMHFSRVDERDWERELMKMKEGGIDVVASYLFWIHHEEIEGVFDFSGNRDLARFCEVCRKVGMPMFLRMGPWAHGEARNGGFPDWLLEKCGGKEHTRCNEEPYLTYAKRFYARVYEEVKGCMDTFLGIQIENELHRNPAHMEELRAYAVKLGFKAPLWTATGWGPAGTGAHIPTEHIIPVYGAYPEAPWTQHLEPLGEMPGSTFHKDWDRVGDIGTDVFDGADGEEKINRTPAQSYPYLTCELGGGIQISYHRRPIISSADVTSIALCRLGSGCNGLGYYMYHGGKNPIGAQTPMMQECRVTGYKNDYPIISYDFQAPLGDCGQIRQSYYELQDVHAFLASYGEQLAPMPPHFPIDPPADPYDKTRLRCAVRGDGERGFLFFNNHVRLQPMQEICEDVIIRGEKKTTVIPVRVAPGAYGIILFGFAIGSEVAEWISAMPVGHDEQSITFVPLVGVKAEICLSDGRVMPLSDGDVIGGVRVRIKERHRITPQPATELTLTEVEKRVPDTVFDHIQNIGWEPLEKPAAKDYALTLPAHTTYLKIMAKGNLAAILLGERLISDYYLYGGEWIVDVRDLPQNTTLTLKVVPFNEENRSRVYLEYDAPLADVVPRVWALDCETVLVTDGV